jgi:hypothetical protein
VHSITTTERSNGGCLSDAPYTWFTTINSHSGHLGQTRSQTPSISACQVQQNKTQLGPRCHARNSDHATLPTTAISGVRHTLAPRSPEQNMATTIQEAATLQSRPRECTTSAASTSAATAAEPKPTPACTSVCPDPTASTIATTIPGLRSTATRKASQHLDSEYQKSKHNC